MGEVPRTLGELKVRIGRNILAYNLESTYGSDEVLQNAARRAPDEHHSEAADRWRLVYPEVAESIGWLTQRALPYVPDDTALAMSSILSDIHKVDTSLTGDEADAFNAIIGPIFQGMFSDGPEASKLCLEALVAYARGE